MSDELSPLDCLNLNDYAREFASCVILQRPDWVEFCSTEPDPKLGGNALVVRIPAPASHCAGPSGVNWAEIGIPAALAKSPDGMLITTLNGMIDIYCCGYEYDFDWVAEAHFVRPQYEQEFLASGIADKAKQWQAALDYIAAVLCEEIVFVFGYQDGKWRNAQHCSPDETILWVYIGGETYVRSWVGTYNQCL